MLENRGQRQRNKLGQHWNTWAKNVACHVHAASNVDYSGMWWNFGNVINVESIEYVKDWVLKVRNGGFKDDFEALELSNWGNGVVI